MNTERTTLSSPCQYSAYYIDQAVKATIPRVEWNDRLRLWMRDQKLSQQALAERLGLTQGAVGHWLTLRREISLNEFLRLCKAAGADPQSILFGGPREALAIAQIRQILDAQPEKSPGYEKLIENIKAGQTLNGKISKGRKPPA